MAFINSIAYYLPQKELTNSDIDKIFPELNINKIAKKIGIEKRHIAAEDETASDMAFMAAEKVLKDYDKSKIDFVLFCTQSPDYYLPTSACILQDRLGLRNIGALDFNLGCSGYIYGLAMAKGLIAANIANNVLLLTGETYSKHMHSGDKANVSIFGDGASATIVERGSENIGEFELGTDGSGFGNLIVKNGAFRNHKEDNPEQKSYGTDNTYDDNHLYMNGPEIFNFTIDKVPECINNTLIKNNISIEDIDYFIFHQANKYMLNHLRMKLDISKGKFYNNLSDTGNTVSATIPVALKRAIDSGDVKSGDKVMLVGFGVGLSWGATVITL
jgi:3-oxoacyl-[acyl-carrier-protein] synthase-3